MGCPPAAQGSMTEDVVASGKAAAALRRVAGQTSLVPQKLEKHQHHGGKSRIVTGIGELDRAGRRHCHRQLTLIFVVRGIGKSNNLLQPLRARSANQKICCGSRGEESAARSSCGPSVWMCLRDNISLVAESDVDGSAA